MTNPLGLLARDSQTFRKQLAQMVVSEPTPFLGLFSSSKSFAEAAELVAKEYVWAGVRVGHTAAY